MVRLLASSIMSRALYGGYGEVVNTADCGSVIQGFDPLYSPHRGIAKW